MSWARALIGKPWAAGACGPDQFDCWGLVRWVQRNHFGRELPQIPPGTGLLATMRKFVDHPELQNWRRVDEPAHGDAVLLAHARHTSHCGVWLDVDRGRVIHALEGVGVSAHEVPSLRRTGWGGIQFYRHKAAA